jgi:hypothetical protein
MPDKRNSTPMAIVSHVTELSGYFNNNTPTAIEQIALKKELCNSFMS